MSSEKSFVGKVEQNVDDLSKVRKRKPWLFYLLVAGFIILGCLYVFEKFWGIPKLRDQLSTQEKQIADLTRDRDSKATQLAPFLAVANKQFQDSTESERLKKLLLQMEEATVQMKRASDALPKPREISETHARKIVKLLSLVQGPEVWLQFEQAQRESANLAQRLGGLFKEAGWQSKINGVTKLTSEGSMLPSFSVDCRDTPQPAVQEALSEIISAINEEKTIWINTNLPPDQIIIYVGPR